MIKTILTRLINSTIVLIFMLIFYLFMPIQTENSTITIPFGTTPKSLIDKLKKENYPLTFLDSYILNSIGVLYSGEVKLQKGALVRINFLYLLTKAKPKLTKITLIEGETKEIFFQLVAKKLDINETKLLHYYHQYAPYPEASIFPDTYFVPKKMNEKKLIQFLLKNSIKKYQELFKIYHIEDNQTKQLKILTIASIIQKESANQNEMPLVASVIYNRLKKNMRLQMDGTLNYGLFSHIKVTPHHIQHDTSHFNTYKHKGLPLSPIGSVSKEAIKSAISPASTNYLYFMRKNEGVHNFSATFKKHQEHIKKRKDSLRHKLHHI